MGLLPTLLAAFCTCILAARLDNDAANYQIRVIDDLYSPFSTFLRDAWAISAGGDYKYVFSLRLEAAETELLNPEVLQWNPSKRFVVTPVYLIFVPPFNAALLAADPTILLLEGDALAVAVDNYQGFMVQCKLSYIASTLNKHLLKMCSGSEGLQVPNDYFDSIFDYRLVIRTKTVSHVNISANIILVDQLIHLMPDDHTPNEVPVSPPPAKYSQWLVKLGIEMEPKTLERRVVTNRVAGHVIMKQLLHSHLNDVPAAVKNYCRSPAAPYYVWNANYAEEVKGATGASEIVTQFWKQIKTELDRMQRLTSQQTLSLYPLSLRDFAIQLFEIDSPTDEHLKRALLFHAGLNRDLPFYSALNNLVAAEPRDSALAAQFYSRLEQEFHRSHRVSEELQKWSQSDQANTLQYSTDS